MKPTECERILSEGVVSRAFLDDEIRDNYAVSQKMKKVWAVELDLLRRFHRICGEHHLRYWVGFGTLLGAVRHHGFIPWDDDMDLWMPREDYDKLLAIDLPLESPYFLQTTLNDDDYYSSFARFRNSRTTGILVSKGNRCNNGIYLDIYPLDGLHRSKTLQFLKSKFIRLNNIMAHAYVFDINPHPLTRLCHRLLRLPFVPFDPRGVFRRMDGIAKSIAWADADQVGFVVFAPYREHRKNVFRKDDFSGTLYVDFENMRVPVPSGYDRILKTIYGNYMEFPPVEDRGKHHDFLFEPDIPYKEFDGGGGADGSSVRDTDQ